MLASREPSPRSPSRAASTMNEVALINIMIIPFDYIYTELVIDNEEEEGRGREYIMWVYIPPVLLMREGGICAVGISHLSNFL